MAALCAAIRIRGVGADICNAFTVKGLTALISAEGHLLLHRPRPVPLW